MLNTKMSLNDLLGNQRKNELKENITTQKTVYLKYRKQ